MKGPQGDDAALAADVVGETSARLAAAGVPPARRRQVLRLLSVLEAVAGPDQRVRRPVGDVAVEFGLPPAEVDDWLDDLSAVGAVQRDGDELVLAGVEPPATGALRLHDFLAVAAAMDEPATNVRPLRRASRPAVGVLAAAALLVIALLAGKLPDRDEQVRTASGVAANSSTTATTVDDAGATTSTAGASTTAAPVIAATTTTIAAPNCPAEPPVLEVLQTVPEANGELSVTGIARNNTDVPASVRTVILRGIELPLDLTVPPHASVPWTATLDQLGAPDQLTAGLGDWSWVPPLPQGCVAP